MTLMAEPQRTSRVREPRRLSARFLSQMFTQVSEGFRAGATKSVVVDPPHLLREVLQEEGLPDSTATPDDAEAGGSLTAIREIGEPIPLRLSPRIDPHPTHSTNIYYIRME